MTKVLIAEDDEQLRDVVRDILLKAGYQTFVAGDGEEALNILQAEKPQVLVLDLAMPKKNGYQVCMEVRANADAEISGIKIIVTSGKQYPLDIRAAHEFGADDYLVKPYHVKDLLAAMRDLLAK
jgi:DNA-binding response OmpR family regulator